MMGIYSILRRKLSINRVIEMDIEEKCKGLRNGVLEIIVDNCDYFRENKSHLAWALMNFDLIHRASRLVYNLDYYN